MTINKSKFLKFRKQNILFRFFLCVLLVATVSVLFLAAFIFSWLQGRMLHDISQMKENELQITGTVFQEYIERARHFAMVLYKNPNMKSVMLSPDQEWNSAYSYSVSQVQSILTLNPVIHSIYVANPGGIAFFVSNDTETKETQEELLGYIQSSPGLGQPVTWNMRTVSGRSIPGLTVYFRESITESGKYSGAIAVNIDMTSLRDTIFSGQLSEEQTIFILDCNGKEVLRSFGGATLAEKDYTARILNSKQTDGMFRTTENGKDLLISYTAINQGDFFVISEMEYHSGARELIRGRDLLFLVCGCMLVILVGASLWVSYLAYRPVGNVFNNIRSLFHMPELEEERADETHLISNTLTRIAERMNSLEKQSTANAVAGLLNATGQSQHLPESYFVQAGILLSENTPFLVAVMRIDHFSDFTKQNSAEARAFQVTSICALTVEYFQDTLSCSSYQTEEDSIGVILSPHVPEQEISPHILLPSLAGLEGLIHEALGLTVSLGVSNPFSGVGQLSTAYAEAYHLTKQKIIHESGHIFVPANGQQCAPPYTAKSAEDILQAVKNGSEEDFLTLLMDFESACQNEHYEQVMDDLTQLALEIQKIAGKVAGKSSPQAAALNIRRELEELHDREELNEWFITVFRNVVMIISDANCKKTHDLVEEAIRYIQQHFEDQQLSVNHMSDKLSISTGYFSRIFNEVTGSSFPDYVNNLRLEQAWSMLVSDKGNSIREIAAKVGYSSESYFSSSFKKKYGISPSKWRINHQNNIED